MDDSFGSRIRQRREDLGLSLDDIEDEIKVRKYYLKAIEENKFNLLPARVYACGFVKQYCRLLNLDEEKAVREFKSLAYGKDEEEEAIEVISTRQKLNLPLKNVIAGLAFLAVVVLIGGYLVDFLVSPEAKKSPATPNTPRVVEPKAETPTPNVNIQLTAEEKCWLSVKADGQEIFRGFMEAGDIKMFSGESKVYLTMGNAGGVRVQFNGKDMGFLGRRGQVLKNLEFPPSDATVST